MRVTKITEQYFKEVKRTLRWTTCRRTAHKHGISLKTVLQIKGSKDYAEYKAQCKAQHPKIKFSLRDEVLATHRLVFEEDGKPYINPGTAQNAINALRYKFSKK